MYSNFTTSSLAYNVIVFLHLRKLMTNADCVISSACLYNAVVTCEIKLFRNNFEITSVYYLTCKGHDTLESFLSKSYFRKKTFQCVMTLTTSEIISKLFRRLIAAYQYFQTCSMSLKLF